MHAFRAALTQLLWLLASPLALAQTPAAPVAVPTASMGSSLFQLFLGLGGVLALIVGALWLLKKLTAQRGEGAGLMRVVSATAVGARERVVIVEVGSTWLVLGVAPGRVSPLAEVPRQSIAAPPEVARPVGAGPAFADWLARFRQGK